MRSIQLAITTLGVVFALAANADAQPTGQRSMVGPALRIDVQIPFTMKTLPDKLGVAVLSYGGADRLLQQGDVITWVAKPGGNDDGVAVTSTNGLENEIAARLSDDQQIAVWVHRDTDAPKWVILKLDLKSVSGPATCLPFTVREVEVDGTPVVQVVSYSGTDRMLYPGDVIVTISKRSDGLPGSTAVWSASEMEADILALRGEDGRIGLVVLRNGDYQKIELTIPASGTDHGPETLATEESSKLHMLSVSNRDPNESDAFRWGCYFDVYRMEAFLQHSIPAELNNGASTFHAFENAAEALLESIRAMGREQVGPNDTFLIYYSGHGRNDATQGHLLELTPGEKVTRAAIRQAMQESGARLCVLITDCCATGSMAQFGRLEQKVFGTPDYNAPYWNANICRYLFFRHKGFVDITSCGPGELAWSVGPTDEDGFNGQTPEDGSIFEHGGLFTTSLLEILAMNDGELERQKMMDPQGRVTWSSIIGSLKKKTEDRFQKRVFAGFRTSRDRRRHKHQTVTDIALGQPVGAALPTTSQSILGAQFTDSPNGVVVTNIDSDRTGSWVGLKPGDTVIRIGRQAEVPVYDHFWKDRKFSNGVLLGTNPTQITSLNQLRQLTTAGDDGNPPFVASGMWQLTVQREGSRIEVPVRITGPSGPPYGVYSIELPANYGPTSRE